MDIDTARRYAKQACKELDTWAGKVELGERYYRNDTDIKRYGAAAIDAINTHLQRLGENPLKSADNRISENWMELLISQKVAYLLTYPPVYTIGDGKDTTLSEKVADTLGDNWKKWLISIGTAASNAGTAWLHYWWTEDGALRMGILDAGSCVAIHDKGLLEAPTVAVVRRYQMETESGKKETHYEVWDDKEIVYLQGDDLSGEVMSEGGSPIKPHDFGEIPFIEFSNNPAKTADLNKVKGLVDEHEKVVSGFANDLDDIQEIIWILVNYGGEREKSTWIQKMDEEGKPMVDDDGEPILEEIVKPVDILQEMKARKLIHVDEKGDLKAVRGEIPYEARSVALNLLHKQIFISGQGIDPAPDKTGQATGAYMDYLYQLLELKSGMMESEFEGPLKELARAILRHFGLDDKAPIELTWTRNKPRQDSEIVQRLNATPSTVMSDYTKRRKHPDIDDPDAEDKLVAAEQTEAMQSLFPPDEGGGE